jgi:hypothetical protein
MNDCGREGMEFLTEKFVDFESLKLNGVESEISGTKHTFLTRLMLKKK